MEEEEEEQEEEEEEEEGEEEETKKLASKFQDNMKTCEDTSRSHTQVLLPSLRQQESTETTTVLHM